MTWTWAQNSGTMYHDGELFGTGYSGKYTGKNNGAMQDVKDTGPLPVGLYHIGDAYSHPVLGPVTMNLTPDPSNVMFGRDDFRIHGDSIDNPGMASEGCIVLGHLYRAAISASDDKVLQVVADFKPQEADA